MKDSLKAWIEEAKRQIESGHYKPDVIDVKMLIEQIEKLAEERVFTD